MTDLTSLFHAQSYQDALADYERTLASDHAARWDYIVLTASDECQAEGFRAQLNERRQCAFLPDGTRFLVIPDPDGRRVGSGGATLNVLRAIAEEAGRADFAGLRILLIHSGGDSRRVPQYSALGKLFSPVPRMLPGGRPSTLFDETMIAMAGVARRIRAGMVVLSGDVLLLFNPLQIDFPGTGAAAISFKEPAEVGKNHGVYLRGENGLVARCLQKKSVETLRSVGAVNEDGRVDIDTGAVIFAPEVLAALYGLLCVDGAFNPAACARLVNEQVRLNLYTDFLLPLAEDTTLDEFLHETPENGHSDALNEARLALWQALRPFRMKLLRLAPAKFIHFGTTAEILRLMHRDLPRYRDLGWARSVCSSVSRSDVSAYCSVLAEGADCGAGVFLEVSNVHSGAVIGANTLLSHVDIHDETIPPDVVLHGLKQRDGRFVVRIWGTADDPKQPLDRARLFGVPLTDMMARCGLSEAELFDDAAPTLWTARLYPVCASIREGVAAALNLYRMMHGAGDLAAWRTTERKSLAAGFHDAAPDALLAWSRRMRELVAMESLARQIAVGTPVEAVSFPLAPGGLTRIQEEWLAQRLQDADASEAMRLHYYLGRLLGGTAGERHIAQAFRSIRDLVVADVPDAYRDDLTIACERYMAMLPLRVNWGGGWTDTPPYCIERGGTVLNAAIALGDGLPVSVTLEQIGDKRVIFDSRDMDVHGEFTRLDDLQDASDPYDPFVLQKAALIVCGVIPAKGGSLDEVLTRMGSGFIMHTEVTGVPKGSGLGTSSILAAACVKALHGFFGLPCTDEDVYAHVLRMEQLMSTGGGWQDQVGGVAPGVKLITSLPGAQNLRVQALSIPEGAFDELQSRFCLIYTGQRRLARNLLRDVVGRYIGAEKDALHALNEMQRTAALMRFELERGHIDDFAALLDAHWELARMLDAGSSNTLIEQIFTAVDDLIDGRMVCGAGGGGFLQVVLRRGVAHEAVHQRLRDVFQDSDVGVWPCRLLKG